MPALRSALATAADLEGIDVAVEMQFAEVALLLAWPEADFLLLVGGDIQGVPGFHSQAAPRTPLESPWRGGSNKVSTRSENT